MTLLRSISTPRFSRLLVAIALVVSVPAGAQTAPVNPIRLEKLITGVGALRLDTSFSYANGSFSLNPFGTGPGPVAPVLANASIDSDSFATTLTMSYGLTRSLQVSVATAYVAETNTTPFLPELGKSRHNSFSGLNLSLSYQLLNAPASKLNVIGYAGVDIARELYSPELGATRRVSGRSGSLGVAINKVVDPLVFSISAAYQRNLTERLGETLVRLPNALSLSPGLSFQVNERVALGWGANISRFGRYAVGDESVSGKQTVISFNLSTSFQFDKDAGVSAQLSFPTGRSGPSTFSVRWVQDF